MKRKSVSKLLVVMLGISVCMTFAGCKKGESTPDVSPIIQESMESIVPDSSAVKESETTADLVESEEESSEEKWETEIIRPSLDEEVTDSSEADSAMPSQNVETPTQSLPEASQSQETSQTPESPSQSVGGDTEPSESRVTVIELPIIPIN